MGRGWAGGEWGMEGVRREGGLGARREALGGRRPACRRAGRRCAVMGRAAPGPARRTGAAHRQAERAAACCRLLLLPSRRPRASRAGRTVGVAAHQQAAGDEPAGKRAERTLGLVVAWGGGAGVREWRAGWCVAARVQRQEGRQAGGAGGAGGAARGEVAGAGAAPGQRARNAPAARALLSGGSGGGAPAPASGCCCTADVARQGGSGRGAAAGAQRRGAAGGGTAARALHARGAASRARAATAGAAGAQCRSRRGPTTAEPLWDASMPRIAPGWRGALEAGCRHAACGRGRVMGVWGDALVFLGLGICGGGRGPRRFGRRKASRPPLPRLPASPWTRDRSKHMNCPRPAFHNPHPSPPPPHPTPTPVRRNPRPGCACGARRAWGTAPSSVGPPPGRAAEARPAPAAARAAARRAAPRRAARGHGGRRRGRAAGQARRRRRAPRARRGRPRAASDGVVRGGHPGLGAAAGPGARPRGGGAGQPLVVDAARRAGAGGLWGAWEAVQLLGRGLAHSCSRRQRARGGSCISRRAPPRQPRQPRPSAPDTPPAIQAALAFVPLRHTPKWAAAFVAFACSLAEGYFPACVVVEDEASLDKDTPYVVGEAPFGGRGRRGAAGREWQGALDKDTPYVAGKARASWRLPRAGAQQAAAYATADGRSARSRGGPCRRRLTSPRSALRLPLARPQGSSPTPRCPRASRWLLASNPRCCRPRCAAARTASCRPSASRRAGRRVAAAAPAAPTPCDPRPARTCGPPSAPRPPPPAAPTCQARAPSWRPPSCCALPPPPSRPSSSPSCATCTIGGASGPSPSASCCGSSRAAARSCSCPAACRSAS
jgi:hypothetical protein